MLHQPKIFKMPHWPIPKGNRDINLGLERVTKFLEKLGNPHNKLPPIIHVAGTNGKGSTIAYLQAIFESAGYNVHKYISPHVIDFNERIVLNGEKISNDLLFQLCEECRYISETENFDMTFFEGVTAMAFLAFSRTPADVLLLEVGMGGRLDATNVIENPLATVITSISFDHMEYLGDSISKIAAEKAGIIKSDSLVISSWQSSEAYEVISKLANQMKCERYLCGDEWNFSMTSDNRISLSLVDGNLVKIADAKEILLPKPSLIGIHQHVNASTAAVTALRLSIDNRFWNINQTHIDNGLQKATWQARMQKITQGVIANIVPDNIEIWLDGAHNEAGAQMVVATLQNMEPEGAIYMVHGRTRHRDMAVFLQHFVDVIELACCVEIMSEPDSEDPYKIQNCCEQLGISAIVSESVSDAVKYIADYHTAKYPNAYARIIICGSLYLAGDVLLSNSY